MRANFNLPVSHHREPPPNLQQDERQAVKLKLTRELGFTYAAMDLLGYRSGSMNETLSAGERSGAKSIGG